jgi:hypothetical protein
VIHDLLRRWFGNGGQRHEWQQESSAEDHYERARCEAEARIQRTERATRIAQQRVERHMFPIADFIRGENRD